MGSDERDAVDRLIEGALSRYSAEEPRAGIEGRVLARVRTDGVKRGRGWPRWAFAAAALVCLVMLAVTLRDRRAPVPRETARVVPTPAVAPDQPPVPRIERAVRAHRKRESRRTPLPKQQTFPAPARVTNEERALLALVTRAPEEAQQILEAQQRRAEPIQIDEIKIEPLRSEDLK